MTTPLIHCSEDAHVRTDAVEAVSVINRRQSQQDSFLVGPVVCAVADGMGGHPNGADASKTALAALADALSVACGHSAVLEPGVLTDAVAAAHAAVVALSDGGFRNPGTTLVAVGVCSELVAGVWVGDSRAYLVDAQGKVSCLTEDHAEMFGGLHRALGDHGRGVTASPGAFCVPVGVGARVLLCSDGVSGPADRYDELDGDQVLADLLPAGLEHLVRTLAARGSDNATAVLIDVDRFASGRTGDGN